MPVPSSRDADHRQELVSEAAAGLHDGITVTQRVKGLFRGSPRHAEAPDPLWIGAAISTDASKARPSMSATARAPPVAFVLMSLLRTSGHSPASTPMLGTVTGPMYSGLHES